MTRTLNSAVLDGRVVFQTRHISFGVLEETDNIERQLKEKCPDLFEKLDLKTLAIMLASTVDITFEKRGDEQPMVLDLMDFWAKWKKKPAVEDAVEWRKFTSYKDIYLPWFEAVNEVNAPVRRPEQLPESMLTEEERAQLEDPNSPLVSPEESLEKASSVS